MTRWRLYIFAWLLVFGAACGGRKAVTVNVKTIEVALDARVHVAIEIQPRVKSTFHSLSGILRVDGRETPFTVEGLRAGDILSAHTWHPVSISLRPDLGVMGFSVVRGVLGKPIWVEFEGQAEVSAMGRRRRVPVQIRKSLEL